MSTSMESASHEVPGPWLRRAALLLIATGVIFFAGMFVAQFSSTADYSMSRQTISELGITTCGNFKEPRTSAIFYVCSPLHFVMDATFVINGIFITLAAMAIRPLWPGGKARKVGLLLIGVAGVAEMLAGLSPVNLRPTPHEISAAIAISFLNIGLTMLGLAARKKLGFLGRFTLICGSVGMLGFLMDGPPYVGLGYGGWERVAGFAFEVWALCLGSYWLYDTRATKNKSKSHIRTKQAKSIPV